MSRISYQVIILSLATCFSVAHSYEIIGKPSKPMAPMEKPKQHVVGDKYVYQNNMKDGITEHTAIVSHIDGVFTFEGSNGCTFARSMLFQPSLTWGGCGKDGKNSGSQSPKLKGEIWPLTKGKKFSFKVKNGRRSNGNTWSDYVKCKVKKEVRIKTVAGEFDAYKLVCSGKWSTSTRYISPEAQTIVAYKKVHKNRGKERESEWVRWE